MKKTFEQWAERLDGRSLRERLLVFAAAALGVFLVIDTLALEPLTAKRKALLQTLSDHQVRMDGTRVQLQALVGQQARDPDAELRARLAALKQASAEYDARLARLEQGLVGAAHMADVLRDLLARNRNVRLVALKSLSPEAITAEGKPADAGKALLYRHGVEITVEGSYADLLAYVNAIDGLPWRLYWGGARLAVEEYPRSRLTLTLYTLSVDKSWLAV